MGTKDPRVDAYIETKAADFARPILKKLRALVHKGCPEVSETIKWGMPAFEYKGPFCGMAAFKNHCVFGFWKSAILFNNAKSGGTKQDKWRWGAPGRDPGAACITSVKDLPSDTVILSLIKKAMKLNDEGVKVSRMSKQRPALKMPKDLSAAINKSKKAAVHFKAFSPSKQRDYIEWITEAKTDATREKRMKTAVEWISQGKSRNWKYERA
jgi:uncharacterized protein YdeI (YjbR/CyaY-like superfamily)